MQNDPSRKDQSSPEWFLLGAKALEARQFDAALLHLAEGRSSVSYAVQAQIGIGKALEGLGKIEAARIAFQGALRMSPRSDEAAAQLAALPPIPPTYCEWHIGQKLISDINRHWQYKVLEVRRGGFGVVYIVSDFEQQPLVLKTLRGHISWNEEDRRRFEREIVTWLRIGNHPRIVRAICLDRVEGRPVLIMEYLPGGTVGDAMTQGPLDIESALSLGLDVCEGMNYAHKTFGIVHRDLKPSNCLLTRSGRLKVTDFGLAKLLGEFQARDFGLPEAMMRISSLVSTPLGTQSYMSPEQFEWGAVLDTRADIYSFGVMLFEMLTGELPLVGPVAQELVQQSDASQLLPKHLQDIIIRCVALDRDERPADFGRLQVELAEEYRKIVGKEAPPLEKVPASNEAEYNALGMTFSQLGHLEEAVQFFDQGLDISPADRYLLTNKGTTLRKSGSYQQALKCYDAALEIAPDSAAIWGNVAQLFIQMDDYPSALDAFGKALSITPEDPVLIGNKAVALFHVGNISEALSLSDIALAANSKDVKLLTVRAGMLFELGRHQDALECLDRAIAVDPLNHEAWAGKAVGLHKTADYDDALRCAQRSLELRPHQPNLLELKGKLLGLVASPR